MSNANGTLLWNRRRLLTLAGGNTLVDTGLQQPNQQFGSSSVNEPPLGIPGTTPPADGTTPASRIQVIPLAPLAAWMNVTIGEPYFDTTSGTVKVQFRNSGSSIPTLNVLFWDPHTAIGPGQADTYQAGG